jgi:hypothetical protein
LRGGDAEKAKRGQRGPVRQEIPGRSRDQYDQRREPERERRERQTLFRLKRLCLGRRLRLGGDADLKRIDADRLGDVLELGRAEIGDREIEPLFHLPLGALGKTDGTGVGDSFQSRGDIDAVAHGV